MQPQHVAPRTPGVSHIEASASQIRRLGFPRYLFDRSSIKLSTGTIQVIVTSERGRAGSILPVGSESNNRRSRCQRASNYLQFSAFSLWLQPVQKNRLKSSLSSNQSAKSRFTQASTSKNRAGRATEPALILGPECPTALPEVCRC